MSWRRRALLLCLLTLAAGVFAVQHAHAAPSKCDAWIIDPLCEAGKTVAGKAGEVITAPVRYAANGAVDAITSWVADAAQWTLGKVISFIDQSTTPTLDATWFVERYRFMIGLAALVVVPMLLIATIRAVMTQDIGQLIRSFFVYLPVAILGAFVAIHLTQALLSITDSLSSAVARNVAGDVSKVFDSVGGTLSKTAGVAGPAAPSFALFFGALLLIVGAFFVWLELLVRSAAVTAAVFFLPMILAGLVWPSAMRWTKRLIEILIALILSKFVIVAVISLATSALADPGGGGFGTVMGAAALMLMAAFSPFAVLKLVPMVEGAAIDHLQGRGRGAVETFRPAGGMNQIVSVMKAKTRGSSGPGLAVAGTGAGGATAAAGPAGAAAAGGVAAARATRTAVKTPGDKLDKQIAGTGPAENSSSTKAPVGGRATAPPTKPRQKSGGE